jgi:hypothetical protein
LGGRKYLVFGEMPWSRRIVAGSSVHLDPLLLAAPFTLALLDLVVGLWCSAGVRVDGIAAPTVLTFVALLCDWCADVAASLRRRPNDVAPFLTVLG